VVYFHAVNELGLERFNAGMILQEAAPIEDEMGGIDWTDC